MLLFFNPWFHQRLFKSKPFGLLKSSFKNACYSYQKTVYKAASTPKIIIELMINPGVTLNIDLSNSIVCTSFAGFGFDKLKTTMMTIITINVIDIRSKKGKSGNAPFVHTGKNLSTVEIGMVNNAPAIAAAAVVGFQNKPSAKMANTPGEIKPTYSCINW